MKIRFGQSLIPNIAIVGKLLWWKRDKTLWDTITITPLHHTTLTLIIILESQNMQWQWFIMLNSPRSRAPNTFLPG